MSKKGLDNFVVLVCHIDDKQKPPAESSTSLRPRSTPRPSNLMVAISSLAAASGTFTFGTWSHPCWRSPESTAARKPRRAWRRSGSRWTGRRWRSSWPGGPSTALTPSAGGRSSRASAGGATGWGCSSQACVRRFGSTTSAPGVSPAGEGADAGFPTPPSPTARLGCGRGVEQHP